MNARKINLGSEKAIDTYLDATPLPYAMTFGGDTPCVEVMDSGDRLILDCGSGLAKLGKDMMDRGFAPGNRIDILQTHTHWDHIIGFPYFDPAYTPGTEIHIHGVHPNLKSRFEAQMDLIHFPITIDEMKASVHFHQHEPGEQFTLGRYTITTKALHHPGGSYAYRINSGAKTLVFATDGEYKNHGNDYAEYVDFYRNADALVFDAMYATLEKTIEKENFGHSTPVIGINIALNAKVKTLFLFHHDPESNDSQILEAFNDAGRYLEAEQPHFPGHYLKLIVAYDKLEYEV
jgi:ribonuclease BN (tRNA processing enzyme)